MQNTHGRARTYVRACARGPGEHKAWQTRRRQIKRIRVQQAGARRRKDTLRACVHAGELPRSLSFYPWLRGCVRLSYKASRHAVSSPNTRNLFPPPRLPDEPRENCLLTGTEAICSINVEIPLRRPRATAL